VIAWLLGNECHADDLGLEFLRNAVCMCKSLDPQRPVSFSHLYAEKLKNAKKPYIEAGLDYYDYHPYTPTASTFAEVMEAFDDKPLVFVEWGGWFVRNSEGLLKLFGKVFTDASAFADSDPHHLNGIAYWEWADTRQYGRGYPACECGILTEGLVDEKRNKKRDYSTMQEIFAAIDSRKNVIGEGMPEIIVPGSVSSYGAPVKLLCVDLGSISDSPEQRRVWESIDPTSSDRMSAELCIGAIPFLPPGAEGRPVVLSRSTSEVVIPIGRSVRAFHFLGHVSINGLPLWGRFGEPVAQYVIESEEGSAEMLELQNGIHIARQNAVFESTRIEPIAFEAPVVIRRAKDPDFSLLEIRYFRLKPQKPGGLVKHLRFKTETGDSFQPLLYALTIETD
jgi:hypothetical protein